MEGSFRTTTSASIDDDDDDDDVYLDKLQTRGDKNLSSKCET
jgi:hypothetical protein